MEGLGLSSGAEFLTNSAMAFVRERYGNPPIVVGGILANNLEWIPALQIVVHENLTMVIEPSEETVYPTIFRLRHADVLNVQKPIAMYAVCPEEVALQPEQQAMMRRLKEHGYGLLVANSTGEVDLRFSGVPLIQWISDSEYKEEVKGLGRRLKRKVAQAFDAYQHRPPLGVVEITEVAEGMVLRAGREAVGRGWVGAGMVATPAATLDALSGCQRCQNARAALGGMRSFISEYRNTAHHFPKNKRKAYAKYRECKHAFLDGIKQIKRFRAAMKALGLSGNLP